jgi:hypothetical protein
MGRTAALKHGGTPGRRASMRLIILACLALVAIGAPAPALPHHSIANFDQTKKVTIKGKVVFFRLTSPHSHIDVEVIEGGAPKSYKIFTVGKTVMTRTGWASEYIKTGDQITVTGNPDRTDPTYMYLTQIVFANGKDWEWDRVP